MEFIGEVQLNIESLTKIENPILANCDFGSEVLNNRMFSKDTYNS